MVTRTEDRVGGSGSRLEDLAEALFCSPLRPEQRPDSEQIQAAVRASLTAHSDDPRLCACDLAEAYGECPEITVDRMRWCLTAVAGAFPV